MFILEDDNDAIYSCDRCETFITYDEMYSWHNKTSWWDMWSAINPRGKTMGCDELGRNHYCKDCYLHVDKYAMQMFDVLELNTVINKLKVAIYERIKNNGTT